LTASRVVELFKSLEAIASTAPVRKRARYDTRVWCKKLQDLLSSFIYKATMSELNEASSGVDINYKNGSFINVQFMLLVRFKELSRAASRDKELFLALCKNYGVE
jgi:hypothetical protein